MNAALKQDHACLRCNEPMEKGFCIDYAHHELSVKQERWVSGDPRPATFWSGSEAGDGQRARALKVVTFRCPKCGYLESYAPAQP